MTIYKSALPKVLAPGLVMLVVFSGEARAESVMTSDKTVKPAGSAPVIGAAPRAAGKAAPHQDFETVLRQEYRSAVAAGTDEALILFIARHPNHHLADDARARLRRGGQSERPAAPGSGPEAAILTQFKRVTRVDTVAAYDAFIARHPHHPLAEEARSMRKSARTLPLR